MQGKRRSFEIGLKSRRNGGWYLVVLSGAALAGDPLVSLTVGEAGAARRFIPIEFLRRVFAQVLLVCVLGAEQRAVVEVFGEHSGRDLRIRLVALPQTVAAALLIALRPSILLPGGADKRMRGGVGLRRRLAVAAIGLGPRISYAAWQRRFDCWGLNGAGAALPAVRALVFTQGSGNRAALDATLASLAGLPVTVIDGIGGAAGAVGAEAEFVAVLQAGEVVAPHAIAALARFAGMRGLAIVYADEDRVDFSGVRSDPVFKPEPSRMLMLSGALATGVFLIRSEALAGLEVAALYADALRMAAWLRLSEGGAEAFSGRLPLILTHRRADTAAAPAGVLAEVAQAHLGPAWIGEIDASGLPLRIRPGVGGLAPKVSLIVASTGRLGHVRRCLSAVLEQTDYPDFEMIIVLSQSGPMDAEQQENLAPVVADARVRVVFAPMPRFNYSRANNVGVADSVAPLICLLNDDVAPITPDWLGIMVGHLQDARIAAVGAKLYYPEAIVQHGGVIMGLSGLCDHAFRFLPRGDPGYAKRASVEQELSAVTAACMLIRREVFDAVGGLDEHFGSAYNDVDLCLKIRAAGHGIMWSAQAELWHHETVSFGQHYADADKPLAQRDIAILRARWAAQGGDDPFHNPNLSLEMLSEWTLAFPPRLGGLPEALGLVADEM